MRKTQKPEIGLPADTHLWRRVAESARPLRHKRARARAASEKIFESANEKTAPPSRPVPRAAVPARKPPAPLPALHPGAAPGVDRTTATRLRKGEIAIDATLDLHGMTQKEAHAALLGHIARAHALGQRCLLVVTGKGGKPDKDGGTTGVLRVNMPRWLNEPPTRAHVLAFVPARPRDGGEGAFYVLLRRLREPRA